MELDVSKALLSPGTEFPFTAEVAVPPQDVIGETVTFDTVSMAGHYSAMDGAIRLQGELTTTAHALCAMCLTPVNVAMNFPFDEMFRRDANELTDDAFQYEGGKVALDQFTLTLIMLNLPMRFLCDENCEGNEAYQAFKQDISKSSCEEESPTQRPFEALQRLLTKDEEV
ncbi:MAG TPA: DUF177 domain-containing protein [Candidatus Limiplasma sp.]|mgnify:CR=1 FL=1|nr:DUF177 domain-containing protein [Candidatus Limiplasma sp.]HPS81715.1 DUF177 domain-containing protein [Candidatus Limiplasma sp.]